MDSLIKVVTILLALVCISCSPSIPTDIAIELEKLPGQLDFNIDVKPILSDKCFACHGPDQNKLEADLRLDIEHLAKSNGAIAEGSLRRSSLFHRIIAKEEDQVMPPPKSNLNLSNKEKAILIKWIEEGAEYKDHWAFSKIEKPRVPEVQDDKTVNEIDHFVIENLKRYDLKLNAEAEKSTLLRRVSFDLTGLPPSLKDIEDFENDNSADAYERQVDRLLSSQSYGERMATDWMDVARFADTHGYQSDRYRDMSPWRDWVIKSFNENLPYNEFITWQLAGDLVENPTREQVIATAFLRLHPQNEEGGIVEEEFRVEYVTDRVNTVGTALMGMSVGCAKCHDHKYDPISQKEYYELLSFFDNVNEAGQISYDGAMPVPTIQLTDSKTDSIVSFIDARIKEKEIAETESLSKSTKDFQQWISDEGYKKLRQDYPSDPRALFELNNSLTNKFNTKEKGVMERVSSNQEVANFVQGLKGEGLKLDGDAWLNLYPVGTYDKASEFNISLWINLPEDLENGTIFHKGDGAALFNFKGLHLAIKDNRLELMLACSAPNNAIIELTESEVPRNEWVHLSLNYDGRGTSEGLSVYLDGKLMETEVVIDNLYKDIVLYKGKNLAGLQIGARWRGKGIGNSAVDNIMIYDRELSALEILQLGDLQAWQTIIAKPKSQLDSENLMLLKSHFEQSESQKANHHIEELYRRKNQLLDTIQELMVMEEMPEPRQTYVLERGQYDAQADTVFPNTPKSILPYPDGYRKDRLGLSKWLLHKDHPLTARVAVNRCWQICFGEGLVKTAEDFGNQGNLPKNKELLDWLAFDFRDNDWNVKAMMKKIVMSSTYRQSSIRDEQIKNMDPDNGLFAIGPSERLTAEMIRDNVLASTGLLADRIGGPSVYPYQPDGLWSMASSKNYPVAQGDDRYRRSLYTIWKRTMPHPTQATFDAPERSECMVRRQETNTPLQALALMNDHVYLEGAKNLALAISESGNLADAFTKLTGRKPQPEEQTILDEMYSREYEKFSERREKISSWIPEINKSEIDKLDKAKIASYAVVISTIMNTDATIVKR